MPADPARLRYLADAVATATPAQRIVMLYDRLLLDLRRAVAAVDDRFAAAEALRHGQQIVVELRASLDLGAWSGAENLAALYGFLLRELINACSAPDAAALNKLIELVTELRAGWQGAAEQLAAEPARTPAAAAWVG